MSGNANAGQLRDGRRTLGATRQDITEILASSTEGLTIGEIERAVGVRHPSVIRDSVENALDTLLQDELVGRDPADSRRLVLTDRGRKFALGLSALAGG